MDRASQLQKCQQYIPNCNVDYGKGTMSIPTLLNGTYYTLSVLTDINFPTKCPWFFISPPLRCPITDSNGQTIINFDPIRQWNMYKDLYYVVSNIISYLNSIAPTIRPQTPTNVNRVSPVPGSPYPATPSPTNRSIPAIPAIPGSTNPAIPGPAIPGPAIPGPAIPGMTPAIPGMTPSIPGMTPSIPGMTPATTLSGSVPYHSSKIETPLSDWPLPQNVDELNNLLNNHESFMEFFYSGVTVRQQSGEVRDLFNQLKDEASIANSYEEIYKQKRQEVIETIKVIEGLEQEIEAIMNQRNQNEQLYTPQQFLELLKQEIEAIEQQLKEKERDNKGIISDETIDTILEDEIPLRLQYERLMKMRDIYQREYCNP